MKINNFDTFKINEVINLFKIIDDFDTIELLKTIDSFGSFE